MNLIDALEILKRPPENRIPRAKMFLACGFTPIHLKTLLEAELRLRLPQTHLEVETGLFGDLAGNIERMNPSGFDGLVAVVEWPDLDARLGIRDLGGWQPASLPGIVQCAEKSASRLLAAVRRVADAVPVAVSMPTLPLPPLFFTPPWSAAPLELQLHQIAAELAASFAQQPSVRVLNAQALNDSSPPSRRLDVKSSIVTGFPYTIEHASMVSEMLAHLVENRPAKKGLITDLDDTLWAGLVGEEGVEGISWDLDHRAHLHGLYQQFLASLAGAGVLIAAASKNDPALVDLVLDRGDLLISRKDIFPLEIHWSQKSESVKRILDTWNISADSVVFVDDSPMEVAEVKTAFPEMECTVFPKDNYRGVWDLLRYLRGVFGKSVVSGDDSLRLESIRRGSGWRDSIQSSPASADEFLLAAEACITFDPAGERSDVRAFELVNKTNQFNLNGKRFSEGEWRAFFSDPQAFLLTANYQDKYGALGKISVILGRRLGRTLCVDGWVMSCRAFSRRIEHHCMNYLFEELGVDEIVFAYQPTPRNGPLREFFTAVLDCPPTGELRLSRQDFARNCPPLFHYVRKALHV